MTQPLKKQYHFSVVEEMVMNPKFFAYRVGRIEVYDSKNNIEFEMGFLVPKEFYEDFRKVWDGKSSDVLPKIYFDVGTSLAEN